MVAYLLAPIFAFISSIFFFIPSELMILVLANMNKVTTFKIFGRTIDLAGYSTDFPWLIPIVAAAGSVLGSYLYYLMGSGAMKMSAKVQSKIDSFDMDKLGNVREAVILVANIISVPPVSLASVAAGMVKMKLPNFIVVAYIGKVIRYYAVIIIGHVAIDKAMQFFS